jgi:hypothetical protein
MVMTWLYKEPQKKKFIGVMKGDIAVVTAVMETDNAILPFDSADKKLEMLPPGHDATRIIPSAIIGVMTGPKANATANVTAGRAIHCKKTPMNTEFGLLNTSFIVLGLMPRATPNITKARMILTIVMPNSPKFILTELSDSSCSLIVFQFVYSANLLKNMENY